MTICQMKEDVPSADATVADLAGALAQRAAPLPFSLRVVLENLLRNATTDEDRRLAADVAAWRPGSSQMMVPMRVDRIVLPDSSGLPLLMDLAALRDALAEQGGDPALVEPQIPCDLVIDHSLMVDQAGHAGALEHNLEMEYRRNGERYAFFKWAQQAFSNLKVVPPGMGIIHQIHLERLAKVIVNKDGAASPEFVLGCDSHTPMVNALGVLGWGVGGIDAESAMLGDRYQALIQRVVGVRFSGSLRPGVTTTDLVLTLTQQLRQVGVVGDFVEFTGPGLDALAVPERATLSNMAPEYGATCGYFPIDQQTVRYLLETGRDPAHVQFVEAAARRLGIFRETKDIEPEFSRLIEIDLATIEPSVAGPRRPQDRVSLSQLRDDFRAAITRPREEGGFAARPSDDHGKLAIAAITSCTNTSNPALMVGAGLLARNAVARGLTRAPHVKTSLAPGSRVALAYLGEADLLPSLEQLGFHAVGFGCTTCSGKSGPIDADLEGQIRAESLVAAAILSGNRNFEGRIHKMVHAAYLGSPLLVVAFAIAGRIDIDFEREPLGIGADGREVFLKDIWPEPSELDRLVKLAANPAVYNRTYADIYQGTPAWQKLPAKSGPLFAWDDRSTYIRRPPFFDVEFLAQRRRLPDTLTGGRVLAMFGDSLTTDHVTPSGEITLDTEAGRYLAASGVEQANFNAYTQRRGNHDVLARATFANPRIRNLLVPGREGGVTRHFPAALDMSIFDAAQAYREDDVPMIILAGHDYGMGSSRDWAAKGPALLGVSMIIARSFERIHRSNLIGVGILPAVFEDGQCAETLGLTGRESFQITGLRDGIFANQQINVIATSPDRPDVQFCVRADLRGADERSLLSRGGIFPSIFDRIRAENQTGNRT